jgi:NAD+ diphosphatase
MSFAPGVTTSAARGRLFVLHAQTLCVVRDPDAGPPPRVPVDDAGPDAIYLGDCDGEPCFARPLGDAPPTGAEPMPLRQLYGALSDETFAIAMLAMGILAWDRDHRFCGRCATPTVRSATERVRTCPACQLGAYPRLSPAVIVLVERDGRALLARNARVNTPFFSTLAGFVEIGETLEQTVAREIREEAGIEIADIRYFGSQPWPFTNSLMIGFTARWASGDLVEDPAEIKDAGWFAPDELPTIPPRLSIARELIDDFVRRHLPDQSAPPV